MGELFKFSPMFWYLGAALMVPTANAMATGYDEKALSLENGNMKPFWKGLIGCFQTLLGYN